MATIIIQHNDCRHDILGSNYKVNDYTPFSSQTIRTTIASLERSGGQGKTWGPNEVA